MDKVDTHNGGHISVVIVSYNQFDTTTGPCLNSLARSKDYEKMEVIIVDNNSSDGTVEQLKAFASKDDRMHLILNEKNRGFAGGTNDGVRAARGDVIVLLNSDTIVPDGSISKMARMVLDHEDYCIVGPMTNEAGNDQRIYTSSTDVDGILEEGRRWCSHVENYCYETDLLVFYCVAMKRKLYQELGGLDEDFGLGFYEDTDFCVRALRSGCKLLVAEDIFIYHQGSASFQKDPRRVKKLLRQNKEIFLRKNPKAKGEASHVRQKLLEVMERYSSLASDAEGNSLEDLQYRFDNRLRLAESLKSKSFLKRFFYDGKLRSIQNNFKKNVKRIES